MTPRRVRNATLAILVVGFVAAVAIYLAGQPPPENPLGYDPMDTKKYLHDLEEFGEWFASLWHGRRLAFTVAALSVIAACLFKFFATPLPPDPEAPTPLKR